MRQRYICDASRPSSSARQRASLALSQSKASPLAGGRRPPLRAVYGCGRAGWLSRGCGGAAAVCTSSGPLVGAGRSLVIAADSGRDLAWSYQRVAAELLARSGGRLVHLLLHGSARGADAAIARVAHQLGWSALVLPAELVVAFLGGSGTTSLFTITGALRWPLTPMAAGWATSSWRRNAMAEGRRAINRDRGSG